MTGPRRTPETNRRASAMKPRTIAVPMSGWARVSTQAKPVTVRSGPVVRRAAGARRLVAAEGHPHAVPEEDGVGRAVGGDGDDGGRRAHHHEPDEAEQH